MPLNCSSAQGERGGKLLSLAVSQSDARLAIITAPCRSQMRFRLTPILVTLDDPQRLKRPTSTEIGREVRD